MSTPSKERASNDARTSHLERIGDNARAGVSTTGRTIPVDSISSRPFRKDEGIVEYSSTSDLLEQESSQDVLSQVAWLDPLEGAHRPSRGDNLLPSIAWMEPTPQSDTVPSSDQGHDPTGDQESRPMVSPSPRASAAAKVPFHVPILVPWLSLFDLTMLSIKMKISSTAASLSGDADPTSKQESARIGDAHASIPQAGAQALCEATLAQERLVAIARDTSEIVSPLKVGHAGAIPKELQPMAEGKEEGSSLPDDARSDTREPIDFIAYAIGMDDDEEEDDENEQVDREEDDDDEPRWAVGTFDDHHSSDEEAGAQEAIVGSEPKCDSELISSHHSSTRRKKERKEKKAAKKLRKKEKKAAKRRRRQEGAQHLTTRSNDYLDNKNQDATPPECPNAAGAPSVEAAAQIGDDRRPTKKQKHLEQRQASAGHSGQKRKKDLHPLKENDSNALKRRSPKVNPKKYKSQGKGRPPEDPSHEAPEGSIRNEEANPAKGTTKDSSQRSDPWPDLASVKSSARNDETSTPSVFCSEGFLQQWPAAFAYLGAAGVGACKDDKSTSHVRFHVVDTELLEELPVDLEVAPGIGIMVKAVDILPKFWEYLQECLIKEMVNQRYRSLHVILVFDDYQETANSLEEKTAELQNSVIFWSSTVLCFHLVSPESLTKCLQGIVTKHCAVSETIATDLAKLIEDNVTKERISFLLSISSSLSFWAAATILRKLQRHEISFGYLLCSDSRFRESLRRHYAAQEDHMHSVNPKCFDEINEIVQSVVGRPQPSTESMGQKNPINNPYAKA